MRTLIYAKLYSKILIMLYNLDRKTKPLYMSKLLKLREVPQMINFIGNFTHNNDSLDKSILMLFLSHFYSSIIEFN